METALDYLVQMEHELRANEYAADCTRLAYEVARKLLAEDNIPALFRIHDP